MPIHLDPDKEVGTGFFISKYPLLMLTAHHNLPSMSIMKHALIFIDYDLEKKNASSIRLNKSEILIKNKFLDFTIIEVRNHSIPDFIPIDLKIKSNYKNLDNAPLKMIHHPSGMPKRVLLPYINKKWLKENGFWGNLDQDMVTLMTKREFTEKIIGFKKNDEKELLLQRAKQEVGFGYRYLYPLFKYFRCTYGGSSGAPIFNKDWKIIGIHNGGDKKGFSTGIDINSIIENIDLKIH